MLQAQRFSSLPALSSLLPTPHKKTCPELASGAGLDRRVSCEGQVTSAQLAGLANEARTNHVALTGNLGRGVGHRTGRNRADRSASLSRSGRCGLSRLDRAVMMMTAVVAAIAAAIATAATVIAAAARFAAAVAAAAAATASEQAAEEAVQEAAATVAAA